MDPFHVHLVAAATDIHTERSSAKLRDVVILRFLLCSAMVVFIEEDVAALVEVSNTTVVGHFDQQIGD